MGLFFSGADLLPLLLLPMGRVFPPDSGMMGWGW